MRVVAVDWSGDATAAGQRRRIFTAQAEDDALVALANGRTRREVVDALLAVAEEDPDLVVGLDFAFGVPAWFAGRLGVTSAAELWARVASEGEGWLERCRAPFWGRPGAARPEVPAQLRRTEAECAPVAGIRPKSVFQIGGAGAVGTGSMRGMPHLARLRTAGFSVWPFDDLRPPAVVEIYPRALTGAVRKSDARARAVHVAALGLAPAFRGAVEASDDAFDAALSALTMSRHLDDLLARRRTEDPVTLLEGAIWLPPPVVE